MRREEKTQFDDSNVGGSRRWTLVAWRGRCSQRELLDHKDPSAVPAFLMDPDGWRTALDGWRAPLTSALLCFDVSKPNKPIKRFLERENKASGSLPEPAAAFVTCLSPQTTEKRDGRPGGPPPPHPVTGVATLASRACIYESSP